MCAFGGEPRGMLGLSARGAFTKPLPFIVVPPSAEGVDSASTPTQAALAWTILPLRLLMVRTTNLRPAPEAPGDLAFQILGPNLNPGDIGATAVPLCGRRAASLAFRLLPPADACPYAPRQRRAVGSSLTSAPPRTGPEHTCKTKQAVTGRSRSRSRCVPNVFIRQSPSR
jgi:hypothetical protein